MRQSQFRFFYYFPVLYRKVSQENIISYLFMAQTVEEPIYGKQQQNSVKE
jgi:hypothetical protein